MRNLLIVLFFTIILVSCEKSTNNYKLDNILRAKEVRKIFSHLVDKEYTVENMNRIYNSRYSIANSIFPENDYSNMYTYDVQIAKQYWDNVKKGMGVSNADFDFYANIYSVYILEEFPNDIDNLVGININYLPSWAEGEFITYIEHERKLIFISGYYIDNKVEFLSIWLPGGKKEQFSYYGNFFDWYNEEYNRIVKNLKCGYLQDNEDLHDEAIAKAEKILLEEYVLIPIFYRENILFFMSFNMK